MPKQQEFCMMHYIKLYGRSRAAFIMALVLSVSASCTRIEIVPRPEPESGAIVFNPKVKTDSWLSVSPASAKSGAVPPNIVYASSAMHRDGGGSTSIPSPV